MSALAEGSDWLVVWAGWLGTYAVHSALLLGFAAAAAEVARTDAWREFLWKTALIGGLVTATFQTASGYTPFGGRWAFDAKAEATAAEPSPFGPAGVAEVERRSATPATDAAEPPPAATAELETGNESVLGEGSAGGFGSTRAWLGPVPWAAALAGGWFLVAAVLIGGVVRRHLRLFRLLAGRRPVTSDTLQGMLAALRRNAGVWRPIRLSVSPVCPTPVALGWSEICVPQRFLWELDPEQQRSALAHELAHLARRDPAWELFAGVIEALFFFQPLNRLARLRIRDAVENLCDDWAVRLSGSPLGLARCLTDVASWVGTGPEPLPTGTMAMAEGGSPLLRRVRRLADHDGVGASPPRFRLAGAMALLALTATAAPAISLRAPWAEDRQGPVATLEAVDPPAENVLEGVQEGGYPDSVIVHPDPAAPLAERWAWALARRPAGGFSVAWGVDGGLSGNNRVIVVTDGRRVVDRSGTLTSNSAGSGVQPSGAPSLQQILAGRDVPAPRTVFVFDFGPAAEVAAVRLRSSDAPLALGGRTLLWLGSADTPESLAQLRRLYSRFGDPALRKEIAAALSLHQGQDQVLRTVRQVIAEEESAAVRSEAVQWLPRGQQGGAEMVELLERTALTDPSSAVRNEAVDALGAIGSPVARAALRRLIRTAPGRNVRLESVDALAAMADTETLLDLARNAPDPEVRAEAVEALAVQPSVGLVSTLVRIASEDAAERVRMEAVDQLGNLAGSGSEEARRALVRMVESHPDWKVRSEAAQTMARQNR